MPDWLLAALLAIGPLLILLATAAVVLVLHIRRADKQSMSRHGPRCAPHSAEPAGRWAVSRLGDDLLGDNGLRFNTDPDPPPWRAPQPPLRAPDAKGP